ncbi:hypothetical protein HDU81_001859 [Chytriomyces hyalinus]|nr:hypothetical protein HDU81_001859 [Chytriomyces hyalinus]
MYLLTASLIVLIVAVLYTQYLNRIEYAPTSTTASEYLANINVDATHPWFNATTRALSDLQKMTPDDKHAIIMGSGYGFGPCLGNVAPIPHLGFNGLCLQDAPMGVRAVANVTAFPSGLNLAATFDKDLMRQYGEAMGSEFHELGVNIHLGPMINLMRAPAAGRNWEGPGADPFLAAISSAQIVKGVQSQGVIATAKHWIANEQETYRSTSSSNLDEKTLMEVYMLPFEHCIEAGVGAIMCGYNKLNQNYACADHESINRILRGPELDFRGIIMTDWYAQYSFKASDLIMPGIYPLLSAPWWKLGNLLSRIPLLGSSWWGQPFEPISETRLDEMVVRILSTMYQFGQDDNFPKVEFNSFKDVRLKNEYNYDYRFKRNADVARRVAAASTVIVRNEGGVLPLKNEAGLKVAIVGEDARSPKVLNEFELQANNDGTLAQGWGSGTADYPYLISPVDGISKRGDKIGVLTSFDNKNITAAVEAATAAGIALVFANANSGEFIAAVEGQYGDRNDLKLWHDADQLIEAVAAVNKKTVVVIHSVGPVEMPWFNHPNIVGIVYALLPGQESGSALAEILFGDTNPSGRLPFTVLKDRTEYPADVMYKSNDWTPQINYTEGLYLDYRHADKTGLTPLIPFGHGLSYTKFSYSNLIVNPVGTESFSDISVSLTLSNIGHVAGHEVVQLYIAFPDAAQEPPKILKGFEKVFVEVGQETTVTFKLSRKELRVWGKEGWENVAGEYGVLVGRSSRDIRLEAEFNWGL